MKSILTILFLTLFFAGHTQIVLDATTHGTTVYTCDQLFSDSGGGGATQDPNFFYGLDEHYVITICPDHPGYTMLANFYFLDLADGDVLNIYDGTSTSAPLIASYPDQNFNPYDSLRATDVTQGGCLTFEFISDQTHTAPGWLANMFCVYPCQAFTANAMLNAQPFSNDPVKLCVGQTVTLNGWGTYPYSSPNFSGATWSSPPYSQTVYADSLYHQSDATSQFTWVIDAENVDDTEMGSGTTYTFDEPGIYTLHLEVKDNHHQQPEIDPAKECFNSNFPEQIIWVSPEPVFSDSISSTHTRAEFEQICLGDSIRLYGMASTSTQTYYNQVDTPDPTAIPDFLNSQEAYSKPILINYHGGVTITDASQIESVCIDLEHQSAGDLSIKLTCPSGQVAMLIEHNLADNITNQTLGIPINDMSNGQPGTPFSYCFTGTASMTMDDMAALVSSMSSIPAGTYLPAAGDFTSLVGCDVNGVWQLEVRDHAVDNDGWVMSWNIDFDPSIVPLVDTFFNSALTSNYWNGPDIPANQAFNDTIVLTPAAVGTYSYTFSVGDDFGCSFDTTVTFTVVGSPDASFSFPSEICINEGPISANVTGAAGVFSVSDNSSAGLQLSASGTITPNTSVAGYYDVVNAVDNGVCHIVRDTFRVYILPLPIANAGSDRSICLGETTILSFTPEAGASYMWTPTVAFNGAITPTVTTTFTLTVVSMDGCIKSDQVVVTVTPLPVLNLDNEITVCESQLPISLNAGSGFSSYSWSTGDNTQTTTVSAGGVYSVTVENNVGCEASGEIEVVVDPCLGIDEEELGISLYPNPSTGVFTIKSDANQAISVKVLNVAGQTVFATEFGSGEALIELSNEATGSYFVEVTQNGISRTYKWVKIP